MKRCIASVILILTLLFPNTQSLANSMPGHLMSGESGGMLTASHSNGSYFLVRHDSRTVAQKKSLWEVLLSDAIAVIYVIVGIAVFSTIIIEIFALRWAFRGLKHRDKKRRKTDASE